MYSTGQHILVSLTVELSGLSFSSGAEAVSAWGPVRIVVDTVRNPPHPKCIQKRPHCAGLLLMAYHMLNKIEGYSFMHGIKKQLNIKNNQR